jgi:hypothetical protein
MMKGRKPSLLDLIAVTSNDLTPEISVGDVGTVVELLPPDAAEVEFLDESGKTRCVLTIRAEDLLVLNRKRTQVA